MEFVAFHKRFPRIGQDECRTVFLPTGNGAIPPGAYAFLEFYCPDKECDCRRVILIVTDVETGEPMASIGYGFDLDDQFGGAILDPLNPQSKCAENFLDLAETVVLSDEHYVARLERHYRMVKESTDATLTFDRVNVQERIANRKARQRLLRQLQARKKRRPASRSR